MIVEISRYIAKYRVEFMNLFPLVEYFNFVAKLDSGGAPTEFERGLITHIEQQVGEQWPATASKKVSKKLAFKR